MATRNNQSKKSLGRQVEPKYLAASQERSEGAVPRRDVIIREIARWYGEHQRPFEPGESLLIVRKYYKAQKDVDELVKYLQTPEGKEHFERELRMEAVRRGFVKLDYQPSAIVDDLVAETAGMSTVEKLLPALKPYDPYKYAEYVLRNNTFTKAEVPIYSGLAGLNPHEIPDRIWAEVLAKLNGSFGKAGNLFVLNTPEVEVPPDMRARPTWPAPAAVIPTKPSHMPSPKDEMEFVADSPEYLAYTIADIGYREKLDDVFQAAIARAQGR